SGTKVSAIRSPVYDWLVYRYLRKKIVDVSILPLGSGQDDCFGKGREAAAHAVELAAIGIRTAKDLQEDSFNLGPVGWQVLSVEEYALRATPTIKSRRYPALCHPFSPLDSPPGS